MTLYFKSTRGTAPEATLREAALAGLASDGGLYVPTAWPYFSAQDIAAMRGLSYQQVAKRVLWPFMRDAMTEADLARLVDQAYAPFADPSVTPLRPLGDWGYVLELFHGPTLAFKDIALQFLGQAFDYFLGQSDTRMTVIGATSGDTGSAAIAALAGRRNVDVYILYPENGPSEIQRRQMTCVEADNVHAVAIRGSFDDCQAIVKTLFADASLCKAWNLSTINSINMLRIIAQIVYYFYAVSRLPQSDEAPAFVVPTGNFGDVFAGYAARQCGLPISKLVVASNSNDILPRFFATGSMAPADVQATLSPSMDIQISSNFERYLFDLCCNDALALRSLMEDLRLRKKFEVSRAQLYLANRVFASGSATDDQTLATIGEIYRGSGYALDPHTAVGVKVAQDLIPQLKAAGAGPVVCLATAHPAKFPDTMRRAAGITPMLPPQIVSLIQGEERTTVLPADAKQVQAYIEERKKS